MKVISYSIEEITKQQAMQAILYMLMQLMIEHGLQTQIGWIFDKLDIEYTAREKK